MPKSQRNFSMKAYWEKITEKFEPELTFKGESQAEWQAWRVQALPKFMDLLGLFPRKVPLAAEVEYSVVDGDLIRERVVFDSEAFMSVPCQVLRPRNMPADGRQAAIICCHGHSAYGSDGTAGIRSSEALNAFIKGGNRNYGEQMARAGYVAICPVLRGFGERRDGKDPFPGRDPCNVNFIKGAILGIYTLSLNLWDIKCCIDYLETRPEVNPNRIGMMGSSLGGTMTMFTTAAEPRIKAADIIAYLNPWRAFGIEDANFCGSQIVPDIYSYLDTGDIAGLIAPRPLLVEMGIYDDCFPIQDLLQGYAGVKRIYEAAGAADKLWAEIHSGGHAFAGDQAFDFFRKYL